MAGKLYGVSVGPGDPELLTLQAARILAEVDCVAAPAVGSSSRAALRIIEDYVQGKRIIDCVTPMARDEQVTAQAYDAIADQLSTALDQGESVAFVTLGDASVYSTWSYVCARMLGRGYEVYTAPGVTSFCAAAARLGEPLCERGDQLLVVPASRADIDSALAVEGTKVFMKAGRHIGELRDSLRACGLASSSALVANCGLEDETVIRDLDSAGELPGYLSVVITKDPRTQQAGASSGDARAAFEVERGVSCDELAGWASLIAEPDEKARARAREKWNLVAKPIGSLGVLEDDVCALAALAGSAEAALAKRAVVVMCADNGVVAQGVSQCGPEVTRSVAESLGRGTSSVCAMARTQGVDVIPVDIGMLDASLIPTFENQMAYDAGMPLLPAIEPIEGVLDRHVGRSTGDISYGPAMTREQALRAIAEGVELAGELKEQGYGIIVAGEMGIGNTTTASAMTAAYFGLPVQQVTGRGAGLDDAGLARKVRVIERALAANVPNAHDALDVLAKLGGFDIAGLTGLFIGGAVHRVAVVVDGFISAVAAYTAKRLCPACACAMLASHVSTEPAALRLLEELGLEAPIQAGLRLGEGTGGVCLLALLDMALALYNGSTFDESGIEPYDPAAWQLA